MEPSRRALSVGLFGLAAGVAGLPVSVSAQAWPQRTVRFVVPFPAGSSPDVTARIIASKLTDSLGQTVIIENRTGAAGIIGADLVAKAQPDGYTLLYPVNSVICANPHLYSKLPYDGLKSFVPVTMTVRFGYVLIARPDFPANDIPSLIAAAKAQPGKFNFGSAGWARVIISSWKCCSMPPARAWFMCRTGIARCPWSPANRTCPWCPPPPPCRWWQAAKASLWASRSRSGWPRCPMSPRSLRPYLATRAMRGTDCCASGHAPRGGCTAGG